MRTFARYETHLPVEIVTKDMDAETERLTSISYGGMRLDSDIPLKVGDTYNFRIPVLDTNFSAIGKVKWSRNAGDHFDIGIEFIHRDEDLTETLVEQVYYIEEYYKEARKSGRHISIEDAADEWLEEQRLQ